MKKGNNKLYSYPYSIINTINSVIKECAGSSGLYPTQANPSQYLCLLFNSWNENYMPDNAFLCIWYNLIQFQRLGKYEWIKSYWEQAVCHANLTLNGSLYSFDENTDNKCEDLLFRFQEFHQMYCAYLLSQKEYELIKHLRNYSNSTPYNNSLVESSFMEICRHLQHLNQPLYMDGHYSFYTVTGVKEGDIALAWYERYCLLNFLVFPVASTELDFYNFSLKELVVFNNSLNNLLLQFQSKEGIEVIIKDPYFRKTFSLRKEQIESLRERLQSLSGDLQKTILEKKENEPINKDVVEQFTNEVNSQTVDTLQSLNVPVEFNSTSELPDNLEIPLNRIDRNFFSDEHLISYVNFPETYAAYIGKLISDLYTRKIKLNTPRHSFRIDFSEVEQALVTLNLNESYSIIVFGVSTRDFKKLNKSIHVHYVDSQYSEIIVLPTSKVPYLILHQPPVSFEINEDSVNKQSMIVSGSVRYNYLQPQFIHYVKLNIIFQSYQGIKSELSLLTDIRTLI